ncbi:Small ubiquitin-related modifier [Phytophthora citrophthora]|uniref:Small ubiquitin-related modifier n=1 Tax=Phytophthora citrophthora TaxID=4793 RepID=A0AAD9GG25_9STRA|nr:Small ubiquitin-related modifier [Phytophthora citrophthora]
MSHTRIENVFHAYAVCKGLSVFSLRFLLDGTLISGDETPKTLELKNNDLIDCALTQGVVHWINQWFEWIDAFMEVIGDFFTWKPQTPDR